MSQKQAKQFERWRPFDTSSSVAFRCFRAWQTELNDLYWSFKATTFGARLKTAARAQNSKTSDIFGIPAGYENNKRLPLTLADWAKNQREFENWTRLSMLVSMAGHLEQFMLAAVRTALQSDPGIFYGSPARKIDGVLLLKYEMTLPELPADRDVTKGDWSKRMAAYKELFGEVPVELDSNCGELEKMRVLRNAIAHRFGRDSKATEPIFGALDNLKATGIQAQRISEDRLKKLLAINSVVAKAIDKHLYSQHIGSYELVAFYHRKRHELPRSIEKHRALQKRISVLGHGFTSMYCKELISYYDAI